MFFVAQLMIGPEGDGCSFVVVDFSKGIHFDLSSTYTSESSVCPYHQGLPTTEPTPYPTNIPTVPTITPSMFPSYDPTAQPTYTPTEPTSQPSKFPTQIL